MDRQGVFILRHGYPLLYSLDSHPHINMCFTFNAEMCKPTANHSVWLAAHSLTRSLSLCSHRNEPTKQDHAFVFAFCITRKETNRHTSVTKRVDQSQLMNIVNVQTLKKKLKKNPVGKLFSPFKYKPPIFRRLQVIGKTNTNFKWQFCFKYLDEISLKFPWDTLLTA